MNDREKVRVHNFSHYRTNAPKVIEVSNPRLYGNVRLLAEVREKLGIFVNLGNGKVTSVG